jgi:hypothetical protein
MPEQCPVKTELVNKILDIVNLSVQLAMIPNSADFYDKSMAISKQCCSTWGDIHRLLDRLEEKVK